MEPFKEGRKIVGGGEVHAVGDLGNRNALPEKLFGVLDLELRIIFDGTDARKGGKQRLDGAGYCLPVGHLP